MVLCSLWLALSSLLSLSLTLLLLLLYNNINRHRGTNQVMLDAEKPWPSLPLLGRRVLLVDESICLTIVYYLSVICSWSKYLLVHQHVSFYMFITSYAQSPTNIVLTNIAWVKLPGKTLGNPYGPGNSTPLNEDNTGVKHSEIQTLNRRTGRTLAPLPEILAKGCERRAGDQRRSKHGGDLLLVLVLLFIISSMFVCIYIYIYTYTYIYIYI